MTHPTTDWSRLTHAYGPADGIPGLFARLDGGPEDEKVWHDLWSALWHQGTVYGASFAGCRCSRTLPRARHPASQQRRCSWPA